MNKLMSFNPEPFDSEFAFEAVVPGFAAESEAFEQEGELETRGGSGRAGSGRWRTALARGANRPVAKRSSTTTRAVKQKLTSSSAGSPGPVSSKPGLRWASSSKSGSSRPRGHSHGQWGHRARPPFWPYAEAPWYYAGAPAASPQDSAALSSEHVSWVQNCLNSFLGLQLPTDGVMNVQTRSAVRSFQERRGLPITGLVGPETEAALQDACRTHAASTTPPPAAPVVAVAPPPAGPLPDATEAPASPPEGAQEFEWEQDPIHIPSDSIRTPTVRSSAAGTPSIKALRENILRIAKEELARWHNGQVKELDPRTRKVLQDYWKRGPGLSFSETELGTKAFQDAHPWSAAFISWVMRKAGAGKAFKYSSSHSVYTRAAKNNRLADNKNPFKAFRPNEIVPRPGDLICRSRAGSGATYDNIRPGMKTHCDIVVDVQPKALSVIGGNVSNSVCRRTVHTDDQGRVTEPHVFAVIRVGTHKPRVPTGPRNVPDTPTPTPVAPGITAPPKLLKQETSPPAATLYAEIDLGIVDRFKLRAAAMSGIFLPEGFVPEPQLDIILYLHGHKADAVRNLTIDQYWNSRRFIYGAFREKLNAARRNAILLAPTLGARSEAGNLLKPGGLDDYLAKALAAVRAYGPGARSGPPPQLRNLIFACHSGGGLPMRRLATGTDKALANLRECWGFDCTYNHGDDTFWAGWARKTPNAKCYFYYIPGSATAPLSESLQKMRVANAVVTPSKEGRHNYVPNTYWQERIQGASFLQALSGGGTPPPVVPPVPSDEPAALKSLSKPEFIEFVGQRAQKAMAATGVPASVTVAQAIVETGWGKHTIGEAKNLFGIKGKGPAGSVRASTREFIDGQWVTVDANFAKYSSFEQSITEHARFFLKNKRYAAALKVKDDPDSFAREIQKAGYATGPDYATQLIKLMKTYNLYRFDH